MSDVLKPRRYDLSRREIPVTLVNKEGEAEDWYVLRECDGGEYAKHLDFVSKRMSLNLDESGRKMRVGRTTRTEDHFAHLINLCLYDTRTDEKVPIQVIRNWPSHVQSGLYEDCEMLCAKRDQSDEDEDSEGND